MPRYQVHFQIRSHGWVDIEADSAEAAEEAWYEWTDEDLAPHILSGDSEVTEVYPVPEPRTNHGYDVFGVVELEEIWEE